MESRVYYGEYSLKHWIDLMLKKNIVLPKYQRSFVWDEKDVKRLINSLKSGQFVQPVTIACYSDGNKKENIILDGQQRLTSLLLTLLGYIPNKSKFVETDEIAYGDDSMEDSTESTQKPIGWTFENLLHDNIRLNTPNTIRDIISKDERYIKLAIELEGELDDFLNNTFLGFSYIVPRGNTDSEATQDYFSTLFRYMNYLGTKLSPLESRRSLYFMGVGYNKFFEGVTKDEKDMLCGIKLLEDLQSRKIDVVRYLSILSQYVAKGKNVNKVLVGYSSYSSRESYYADYVSFVVGLEQENRIDKFEGFSFNEMFANDLWSERYERIRIVIDGIKGKMGLDEKKTAFKGWIDADYWLFGLLYWMLFEGKDISFDDNLIKSMSDEIMNKKNDWYYSKNPNRLGNLRERIDASINIYKEYAK
ncbi:MAG: DUF262 domain-containing protein [Bacteroidales bacterium]|nr:DUF262 domain-containing protein [Bacteroidales bacterium]